MSTNWLLPANEQKLRSAVADTISIAAAARLLGLQPTGGNYRTIKHHITRLNIDTSHHLGQAWNRENYREPNKVHTRHNIKLGLIRQHGHRCWGCGLTMWQGEPIPLELEHISGDNSDNSLSNLQLLCCNCHALTPTWRRRK